MSGIPLEQQESFTIEGPQLQVLGEVESKLPAPARKRPFAAFVLCIAVFLSVFGIGGARLKARQKNVASQFSVTNQYNQGIANDLSAQADSAANLIRQAQSLLGEEDPLVKDAEQALALYNAGTATADDAYRVNQALYGAVDGLYNALRKQAGGEASERVEELYAEFVSRQAVIDREGALYNEQARSYNETAQSFPANVIGALWGAERVPLFSANPSA